MVEQTALIADSEQIRQILKDFKVPVTKVSIDPSWATKPFNDSFACTICLLVAIDPK